VQNERKKIHQSNYETSGKEPPHNRIGFTREVLLTGASGLTLLAVAATMMSLNRPQIIDHGSQSHISSNITSAKFELPKRVPTIHAEFPSPPDTPPSPLRREVKDLFSRGKFAHIPVTVYTYKKG
jgi:hypothetical protein